jgi:8-oxo-dGTP pyrophosphatase MutT (NUDIX family)
MAFDPNTLESREGANAILIDSTGQFILQIRDNNPDILMPGMITFFGGTLMPDEDPVAGLLRELQEELSFNFSNYEIKHFKDYQKTVEKDGLDYLMHIYKIEGVEVSNLTQTEGAGMFIDSLDKALENQKLTPKAREILIDYKETQDANN